MADGRWSRAWGGRGGDDERGLNSSTPNTTALSRTWLIGSARRNYAHPHGLRGDEHGRPAASETPAQARAIPHAIRRLLSPQGHPSPPAGLRLRPALGSPREER